MSMRLKLPAEKVIVWLPATLMRTRCPVDGASPVFQLLPSAQSPLVPTQQMSTKQADPDKKVIVVAP